MALAVLFALMPAFAVGGVMGLPVLVTLAGWAGLRLSLFRALTEKRLIFIGLLAIFVAWLAITSLWSPGPALRQSLMLASLIVTGVVVATIASGVGARIALAGSIATVAVLVILLTIEATTPLLLNQAAQPHEPAGELLRNLMRANSFLVTMVSGATGALLLLGGRIWVAAAVVMGGAVAVLSAQFGQNANAVAFAAGLIAFAAGYAAPRLALWAATGGLALWLLAAPVLTPLLLSNPALVDALPLSWAMREGMWAYTIDRIWEQPLFGHGLEASRTVHEIIYVRGMEADAMTNHPHNASLQIWFELGAVGALIGVALLLVGGRWLTRAYGERRIAAAAACGTLAAAGVIANVSFSAWAEWWVVTLFVAAGVVGAIGAQEKPAKRAFS